MKTILKKIGSVILSAILICAVLPVRVYADFEIPRSCQVQADAGAAYTVKTLDYDYDHNTYLSLRDMAVVLKDTDKAFSLKITKNAVSLTTGNAYTSVGAENIPWGNSQNPNITLRRNDFEVNGQSVVYYTMITRLPSGCYDCFMMAADMAMLLDVDITVTDTGSLRVNTQEPFTVSPEAMEQAGYFYGINGALVGDATTGEIYYQYQSDTPYPIASTSKLMTCLLTMDAISSGQISLEDRVVISDAVQLLSSSDDGVISMEAGARITVQDLLLGTLLPSSNECALCLAETIAGSEEAFVGMMNQKAADLKLSQAVFFNSNGLPAFTEDPIPSKRQNRMSAEDMFRLASYLLKVYPQITDITSLKNAALEYQDLQVRNTNPLLHNLSGVTGLKTGSTNKAGACLVTSLTANDGDMEHNIVVVVFGAESSIERGRVSEMLARYALHVFDTDREETEAGESGESVPASENLPVNAELAVDRILQTVRKR